MKEFGLYTTDVAEIRRRVEKVNLDNIFNQRLC
jgi:hypothetical protein